MKKQIIPALIAKNQKELDERFDKIKKDFNTIHLDVMDGVFVGNKSFMFPWKLPKKNFYYRAHLMIKNPKKWMEGNFSKVKGFIFHMESCKSEDELERMVKFARRKKKEVGLAINPKTSVRDIFPFVENFNFVLIMSVNPGKYGSKFQEKCLKKISEIRKIKPKMKIIMDGGMNPKTIKLSSKLGVKDFVVGSYIQKSKNPEKAIKELKSNKF